MGVTYDSVGAGNGQQAATVSETHTIGAGANALVLGVTAWGTGATGNTATVGTTSMTLLGNYTPDSGTMYLLIFGLLSPPTGTQTITFTSATGTPYVNLNSVAYAGVLSFGTAVNASGSGTAASQTVSSTTSNQLIFQMFTDDQGSASGAPTGYNQTARWSGDGSVAQPTVIGDAPGGGNITFSATMPLSATWGGLAIPLNGAAGGGRPILRIPNRNVGPMAQRHVFRRPTPTVFSFGQNNWIADASLAIAASSIDTISQGQVLDTSSLAITTGLTDTATRAAFADTSLPVTATITDNINAAFLANASLPVTANLASLLNLEAYIAGLLPITAGFTEILNLAGLANTSLGITAGLTDVASYGAVANTTPLAITAGLTDAARLAAKANTSLAITAGFTGLANQVINSAVISLPITAALTATDTRNAVVGASLPITVGNLAGAVPTYDNSASSSYQSGTGSGTAVTWSHTVAAGAYAIIVVFVPYASMSGPGSGTTAVVKMGTVTLSSLGSVFINNAAEGWAWVFGGYTSGSGAQTASVKLTESGQTFTGYGASFTYNNVSSVGILQTAYGGSATTQSVSVPSASTNLVWGAIQIGTSGATLAGFSAFSLNQRQEQDSNTTWGESFIAGDIAGSSSVSVSVNTSSSFDWAAVGLSLNGLAGPTIGYSGVANVALPITAGGLVNVISKGQALVALSLGLTATPTAVASYGATANTSLPITATPLGSVHWNAVASAALALTATPTSAGVRNAVVDALLPITAGNMTGAVPAYDNSAISSLQNGVPSPASFTWTQTVAAGAYVIIAIFEPYGSSFHMQGPGNTTAVVKMGTVTLSSLGYAFLGGTSDSNGWTWVFGGYVSGSGSQTASVTLTQSFSNFYGYAASFTYTNVFSVGTLQTAYGTTTPGSMPVSVSSAASALVWGAVNVSANSTVNLTSITLTQRQAEDMGVTWGEAFVAGDITGATTVSVSAYTASSDTSGWAAVGLSLNGLPGPVVQYAGVVQGLLAITAGLVDTLSLGRAIAAALPITATPTGTASYGARANVALPITVGLLASSAHLWMADVALAITAGLIDTASYGAVANASLPITSAQSGAGTRGARADILLTVIATLTDAAQLAGLINTSLPVTATPIDTVSQGQNLDGLLPITATPTGAARLAALGNAFLLVTATPTQTGSRGQNLDAVLGFTAATTQVLSRGQGVDSTLTVTATPTGFFSWGSFMTALSVITVTPQGAGSRGQNMDVSLPLTIAVSSLVNWAANADVLLPITVTTVSDSDHGTIIDAVLAITATPNQVLKQDMLADASLGIVSGQSGFVSNSSLINSLLNVTADFSVTATEVNVILIDVQLPIMATPDTAVAYAGTLDTNLTVTTTPVNVLNLVGLFDVLLNATIASAQATGQGQNLDTSLDVTAVPEVDVGHNATADAVLAVILETVAQLSVSTGGGNFLMFFRNAMGQ
jgi:hypothetical protein